jgi:beta-mannosidase
MCRVEVDSIARLEDLQRAEWIEVPDGERTVAAALRRLGRWSLDGAVRRFDAEEWWWRTTVHTSGRCFLCLDGLATHASVWLDGAPVLESDDMFVAHRLGVAIEEGSRAGSGATAGAGATATATPHHLVVRFRSLDAVLAARRPRPRWRTPMIEHQQLRFVRTTLLGRTPGWSPPAAVVGPWRGVRLEQTDGLEIDGLTLRARLDEGAHAGEPEAGPGIAELHGDFRMMDGGRVVGAVLALTRDGVTHRAELTVRALGPAARLDRPAGNGSGTSAAAFGLAGQVTIPGVARWWPHTHGAPNLYEARLVLRTEGPRGDGATTVEVSLGRVGFRTVEIDRTASGGGPANAGGGAGADGAVGGGVGGVGDGFQLRVNGVPIFCRGACWTPLDVVSLDASGDALARAFEQLVACGMNMVRVGGTMVYETDDFYDLCDAHGILLWHDLMFANQDYPEDAALLASVRTEVGQFLSRMQGRPSLAVLCGSSEGEQQAAMWGAPRDCWSPPLFHRVLPELCRAALPDVPYWPSSAHGGAFPHQASAGTTSYYGVGAYLRPLEDARRAEVRFASECLAFANVPEASGLPGGPESAPSLRVHHPAWKARTPRDLGAGWDFDDVREHYLEALYRLDPTTLRYADPQRHLALARATTGEVMAAVFGEWRRRRSPCGGGLVWFLRDLWPGAGWGVIDATGNPKAAWWYLRRALAPVSVHISDEGGNGLDVHLTNDGPRGLRGELELSLFRGGEIGVGTARTAVEVPGHGALEIAAGSLFDGFLDLSYAYRFGPPSVDLVVATLMVDGKVRGQAFHFPLGLPSAREADLGLTAEVVRHRRDGRGRAEGNAKDDGRGVDPDTASDPERDRGDAGNDGAIEVEVVIRTRRFAQSVTIDADGFVADDAWFHLAPGAERRVRLTPTRTPADRARASAAALRGVVEALNCERPTRIALANE